jgi:superoxide dismutase
LFDTAEIMKLHHSKHHQAYVTNLNVTAEKLADAVERKDHATVLSLNPALKFNYGGKSVSVHVQEARAFSLTCFLSSYKATSTIGWYS